MLRDRGTIKWTSLMLPEHVALLKEMWEEDNKVPKPDIDEQEMEIMNEKIRMAYHHNEDVRLSVHENGKITTVVGLIKRIDVQTNTIYLLKDRGNGTTPIPFYHIIAIDVPHD
ncbi:MAG TPA: YolD-like family protein [Bacillota bacterium]|nr:YolD-like family protein [Bacillota bacterium]